MRRYGEIRTRGVAIRSEGRVLRGRLRIPAQARGILLLLDDVAASVDLARALGGLGMASLAVDLGEPEPANASNGTPDGRCSRLFDVLQWLCVQPKISALQIGFFARSLNGAAALIEAARRPDVVQGLALQEAILAGAGPWLNRLRIPILRAADGIEAPVLATWLVHNIFKPSPSGPLSATPARAPDPSRTTCLRATRYHERAPRQTGRLTFAR